MDYLRSIQANEWLAGIKKISFVTIPNNDLTMSMWQEAYNKSCLSVDACVRAIQGEELEAFTDTGTNIVNPNSSAA